MGTSRVLAVLSAQLVDVPTVLSILISGAIITTVSGLPLMSGSCPVGHVAFIKVGVVVLVRVTLNVAEVKYKMLLGAKVNPFLTSV